MLLEIERRLFDERQVLRRNLLRADAFDDGLRAVADLARHDGALVLATQDGRLHHLGVVLEEKGRERLVEHGLLDFVDGGAKAVGELEMHEEAD